MDIKVTSYKTSKNHPAHLYLKVQSTHAEYLRLRRLLHRRIPSGFSITNAPVSVMVEYDKKNPHHQAFSDERKDGIFYYGVRIWINEDLRRFSIYGKLLNLAVIDKLANW
jgi:hypothetical protein